MQNPQTPEPQAVRVSAPEAAPYVTYAIIAITALVYVLQLATSDLPIVFLAKDNDLIRRGEFW